MTYSLTVGAVPTGPETVVRPVGEIDWGTVTSMRAAFDRALREAAGDLLVDLSATTFMDCAGLDVLLQARRDWGNRLRLYQPPNSLRRILQALEMEDMFTIIDPGHRDTVDTVADDPRPSGQGCGTRPGLNPRSQLHREEPAITTRPPFDEEAIRAKARELHDATDGTGCECGGKVSLEGVLSSGPWWQRGWYGLATAAIIEEHHLAQGKSPVSTDGQDQVRRQAEGLVVEALRRSGTTEHQANTAGPNVVNALITAGLLRLPAPGLMVA
ncbi:MAG: STAS domain-containing protein [Actinomycetota bacterium]|nr:STAS domain-containing protein [Actinomycetota bacterium]